MIWFIKLERRTGNFIFFEKIKDDGSIHITAEDLEIEIPDQVDG